MGEDKDDDGLVLGGKPNEECAVGDGLGCLR